MAVGIGGVGRGQMAEKQSLGKRWEMEGHVLNMCVFERLLCGCLRGGEKEFAREQIV